MARPRGNPWPVTLEEREVALNKSIEDCQAEVAVLKDKISGLRAELAEVLKEKEERALKELRAAILASGKSVEAWLAAVKSELEN